MANRTRPANVSLRSATAPSLSAVVAPVKDPEAPHQAEVATAVVGQVAERVDPVTIHGPNVALYIPVSELPSKSFVMHIDTKLTPKQSAALRSIAGGLDRQQARLENGTRVVKPNDALKYLLEVASQTIIGDPDAPGSPNAI